MKSIKEVDINSIIPYENNPRNNDNAVNAVANSIKEFGWQQPIVVDKNNVIIIGHTRLKAAQQLGLKTVPVLIADDLPPNKVKALRLADNKTAELADWDEDLLFEELQDIGDIDMSDFGFDDFDDEPELPSDFFEEQQTNTDEQQYLKFGDQKIAISDSDIKLLKERLDAYQATERTKSFVQFLINE